MLFGEKFYPLLNKMPAWRHSLFALVLATRQYPNFALWCEIKQVQGKAQYLNALKACWRFHYDKFNHIDLTEALDEIAPFLPMELEEYSEGDSFAFDAAVMLDAALSSVPDNTKGAVNASQASLASVIRYCEHAFPESCTTEDDLLELEPIQAEMDFQINLMEMVKAPRSPQNVVALCQLALEDGCSNIGLESDLSFEDFAPCFEGAAPSEAESDAAELDEADADEAESADAGFDEAEPNVTEFDTTPPATPWNEHDAIVFSPEHPDGKPQSAELTAALADLAAQEDVSDADDEDDAESESEVAATAPEAVPSYAQMMAQEQSDSAAPAAAMAAATAVTDATEPNYEVAPEDWARTDRNLRRALCEQEQAAQTLEQLMATNARLGEEEALIMAQAQALAQAEAQAQAATAANRGGADALVPEPLSLAQAARSASLHPDDATGEVDVDLEFERIAQTAALLEQQLEQELLLETGQDLDSIIAAGGNIPAPRADASAADGRAAARHQHSKDKGKDKDKHKDKDKDKKGHKHHRKHDQDAKLGKSDQPGKGFKGEHKKHGGHGDHGSHDGKGKERRAKDDFKGGVKGGFKDGFKGERKGDRKGGRKEGVKAAPKVFGAHAPKGKAL